MGVRAENQEDRGYPDYICEFWCHQINDRSTGGEKGWRSKAKVFNE